MNKFIYKLCINLYPIIYYTFWLYFLAMITLYIIDVYINSLLSSIFFILLGLYLGFYISYIAKDYVDKYK